MFKVAVDSCRELRKEILCALQQILLFDRLAVGCLSLQSGWHCAGLQNVL